MHVYKSYRVGLSATFLDDKLLLLNLKESLGEGGLEVFFYCVDINFFWHLSRKVFGGQQLEPSTVLIKA
jgi:hypothetical protein